MYYKIILISIFSVILTSCSPTIQNNGMSEIKFNKIIIEIGKTSKNDLIKKYGPPVFEGVFNEKVIYYVSHKTSYKLLDKIKTKKLLIYEISLNDKNIVKNFKKYSEKDSFNISISDKASDHNKDSVSIWKELLNNMSRNNIQN
jgi:outer membrane protein assembly factor BamE (lipoprotein component of BamABCDE complex)